MNTYRFSLRLGGAAEAPDWIAAGDLASYLKCWEDVVLAVAAEEGVSDLLAPSLSLVGIAPGSAVLQFSSPVELAHVHERIERALRLEDWLGIPRPAVALLHEASKIQERRGWTVDYVPLEDDGTPRANFAIPNTIPEPESPSVILGSTTIIGDCVRVGGATTPKISVRPLEPGSALQHWKCSSELARQAARMLYQTIVLEGDASWSADTLTLQSFDAKRIVPYHPEDLQEAFAELADAVRDAWDKVDAAAFVAESRSEWE